MLIIGRIQVNSMHAFADIWFLMQTFAF